MTQHEELIERVMAVPCYVEDDAKALAAIADALESQSREIGALKEQEAQLCTLYGLAQAECKRLRKDAERYAWVRDAGAWESEIVLDSLAPEEFDARVDERVADAAIAAKGSE